MRAPGVVERSGPAVPGDDPLTDLGPARPCSDIPEVLPFRVWSDGGRLNLAGCVDTFAADRLAAVLAATPIEGPVVVLDLTGLEFADAAATRTLARWAQRLRADSITVYLTGSPSFFGRVWHLLAFDQVGGAVFGQPAV